MRYERGLWFDTEAADLAGGKNCHFGNFVRIGFGIDIGIGEEQRAALRDEQAQG